MLQQLEKARESAQIAIIDLGALTEFAETADAPMTKTPAGGTSLAALDYCFEGRSTYLSSERRADYQASLSVRGRQQGCPGAEQRQELLIRLGSRLLIGHPVDARHCRDVLRLTLGRELVGQCDEASRDLALLASTQRMASV
jgi:hypothetical protein